MENTSTTLLTDMAVLDQRAALDDLRTETLVVHELAHQWFGDLVVINHWAHAWIKEGAATYAESLWLTAEYGEDLGRYHLLQQARSYFSEDADRYRRPMVTNIYQEAIELYDCHIYEKGAWIYHMIRDRLGELGFAKTIQLFLHQFAHRTVETIDLLRAIEQASGKNLAPLFDQYVFRGGYPQYRVTYVWDAPNSTAKLTVLQEQAELFDLHIPISFGFIDPDLPRQVQDFRVQVAAKQQSFYFVLAQAPDWISFDQGNCHLKQVTLDYPLEQLRHGLNHNPDPIARIQAAIAIAAQGGLAAVLALSQAYQQEQFWGVRLEIIQQLGKIRLDQAIAAIQPGLQDLDSRVRCAAISALTGFKQQTSLDLIKPLLKNGDPSYLVEAAAAAAIGELAQALSHQSPSDRVFQLLLTTLETKGGWNEIVRGGAIKGIAKLRDQEQAIATIIKYSQPGVSYQLRLQAIVALGAIAQGQSNAKVQPILAQISLYACDSSFRTQMAVINGLAQIDHRGAIALLQSLKEQTKDGRIKRKAAEAIQAVEQLIGSAAASKQLRSEFDQLKQENQELKSRLTAIEAKLNPAD
ncbi:MAG: M1 family metallopeptidase, partial [Pseudanabaenaceae cyanobacterium bins.68]|nr:M1 family metallopeptidase [Pseudanabaenaceae cyanobacterium bins.68]